MDVITDLAALRPPAAGSAVTIGQYDGVHLGHRAVLRQVRQRAEAGGHQSVVVTFDRHPATVVRPGSAPRLLTDLDQKLELLAASGHVDRTVVIRFDRERAQEEAAEFVQEVLVDALGARVVVVGRDFHFGRSRAGNVDLLRQLGERCGFDVVGVDLVGIPGVQGALSSTVIRRLVAAGDVVAAASLLGRPHEVRGDVRRGDNRGRDLGFPTANVAVPDDILLPAEGIYAGWYGRATGDVHPAAISLGRRPTFHSDGAPAVLEAYLIDFDGDLYGERAAVRFVRRLRAEQRFGSVEALIDQTKLDVEAARTVLAEVPAS